MSRTEKNGQRLLKGGRSGHRYKWSAYKRIEKNEEDFGIKGEEWTEIQEGCL
jgi:hypothetical protein